MMNKDQVKEVLISNGYQIVDEKRTGNDLGHVYKLSNGCIVNCWDTGNVNCQGKNKTEVEHILNNKPTHFTGETATTIQKENIQTNGPVKPNKKVFVVYGHDINARTQLEAMLRRWELEPLILDQLVSGGQTIIEKLEEYTSQANFGIVLATPDDIGYPKKDETKKRFRVRQNVVLELGMLLAKIGREKVAILLSQAEDMESPSDIQGLLYMPFKDNVEEAKLSLAKEMQNNGYTLDIAKLSLGERAHAWLFHRIQLRKRRLAALYPGPGLLLCLRPGY